MLNHSIIGAALACLTGIAAAFLNYLVSLVVLRRKPEMLPLTSVLRQFINILYLAAIYFCAPYTPWERIPLLVGAVVGITVSMFFFTYLLVRESNGQKTKQDRKQLQMEHLEKEKEKGDD
ncbi:MAG: hypothetical protein ACI4V1_01885 [Eubacteriales bacterium]